MNLSVWDEIQRRIDYRFVDAELLLQALTHKSFSNEQAGGALENNERLEFLGDAVLDLVISQNLFRSFPRLSEGNLTRVRADVVREETLAGIARDLLVGEALRLGRGECRTGGRDKDSLLANALEALLGAVFLDGGYDAACHVVGVLFPSAIKKSLRNKEGADFKSRLQELLQARTGRLPRYVLTEAEGPEHQRLYGVTVQVDGEPVGQGQGRTKKAAEQEAARQALERLL